MLYKTSARMERSRGGIKEIPIFAFSLNDKRIYFYGY
jgi:hypothetical protein